MMYGLDLLGIAQYSKVALREFPRGWALGAFSNTFGDARPAVEAIIKSGKCPRVRIQLSWKDKHDYSTRDFPAIRKEALEWAGLVNKYKNVQWLFSGACEHKLNKRDATALAVLIQQALPCTEYVNCIMKGGARIDGTKYINEVHGDKAKSEKGREVFSFDGTPCVNGGVTDLKTKFAQCETFFLWDSRFNGKWESSNDTPRIDRKGWPDAGHIKSIIALAQDEGKINLAKKWLYKSHSENKGTGDPRAENPVIIAPIECKQIELKDDQGKLKVILKYYKPYSGGGHRYYAKKMGYEISRKQVSVWANGKQYGVIHPAFRTGSIK